MEIPGCCTCGQKQNRMAGLQGAQIPLSWRRGSATIWIFVCWAHVHTAMGPSSGGVSLCYDATLGSLQKEEVGG